MNRRCDAIFGTLTQKQTPVYYSGKSTETITVEVDNSTREISADINLHQFLGPHADQAYPGAQGVALENALTEEQKRALQAEQELQECVDNIKEYVAQLRHTVESIDVPTKVSDLENDKNYITEDAVKETFATKTYVDEAIDHIYIPEPDLSSYMTRNEVIEYVDKAFEDIGFIDCGTAIE